mgnify:CR=1 FL=1
MGWEVAGGHLCPGCAHLKETLVDHLQQLQELLVLIVEAAAKNNRTDDVGDSAAQDEGGLNGSTWVMEIVYVRGSD